MDSSHAAQRNGTSGRASAESLILADAFADFISASSRLETFYSDLQKEVSQLGQQLTDRNAALHASLSHSEEARRALQQVMEVLPCAVVVADERGFVSFINAEALRLLHQELVYDSAAPLPAEWLRQMDESAASGEERDFVLYAGENIRSIAVRSRRMGLDGQAGSIHGAQSMVAVFRDVTNEREGDTTRSQRRKAMAMAEWTASLAEEIRSPLASIELFTNLIAKEKGDASRWIAHLRTNTRALEDIFNNAVRS